MRLIVTGGAGFIGCTLTRRLIGQGHEVHVLDVKPEIECRIAELDHTSYHCLDIRSPRIEGLLNQLKPDGVIHLAAVSRVIWGEQYPEKCESVNVEGTMNLLKSSRNLCCPPWVAFSSSREVYGEPACLPVSEEAFLRPMNTYGFSKLKGEEMVRLYTSEAGSSSAILRLSNVYGNEEDLLDRVIPRFIMAGLSGDVIDIQGGDQVFDFTHINDTVSGICLAIENLQESSCAHSETYNIVTGKGTTMRYLVDLVEKGLGWEVKKARTNGRNYDVTRFVGDPQKASVSLGFKASILPDDGIPMTIERLRSIEKWNHNA